ncbi:MAG: DUF456 domain-containing protein [Deferribacteres bacterium]|nr:DUF456 domain-containing protein [candidate division KSB1 bacterium]MCB9509590.1 DUF456 domain-containing protein [Deferribacteres bacterium]
MLESIGFIFTQTLFFIGLLVGIVLIPFGLPGTFLIAALALVHGLLTSFLPLTVNFVLILFGLAVLAEVIEFFLGAVAAKKFGGSKYAMWGAVIGGFVGAVFATGIMPVVGTLIGAFAGAFVGAFLFEYMHAKNVENALRVGFGAFLGAVSGKLMKITLGIAMVVMIGYRLF